MNAKVLSVAAALCASFLSASCATGSPVVQAEQKFRDTFKNMPVDKVSASEIPGVFEVYSQGKLFYYAPSQELMVFGEFYTVGGESITQKKIGEYQTARVLDIPSDVGVTVGDGANELIAFLDPDCGHCAQAHEWIEKKNYEGIKLRVVFLQMNPDNPSYGRAQQFVCAPPQLRREALRQVYAHEDPAPGQHLLTCAQAAPQLAAQAEIAKNLGINGTPTFLLKGQTVLGFNRERLETLLSASLTK